MASAHSEMTFLLPIAHFPSLHSYGIFLYIVTDWVDFFSLFYNGAVVDAHPDFMKWKFLFISLSMLAIFLCAMTTYISTFLRFSFFFFIYEIFDFMLRNITKIFSLRKIREWLQVRLVSMVGLSWNGRNLGFHAIILYCGLRMELEFKSVLVVWH
jgi:hypothetical protein